MSFSLSLLMALEKNDSTSLESGMKRNVSMVVNKTRTLEERLLAGMHALLHISEKIAGKLYYSITDGIAYILKPAERKGVATRIAQDYISSSFPKQTTTFLII